MPTLKDIGAVWAESAAADLGGLIGAAISITGPSLSDDPIERLLGRSGAIAFTACTPQGEGSDRLVFTASLRAAGLLAAVRLGRPAEEFAALAPAAFTGPPLEAWAELMELCAGILGRVLAEEASLPALARGDSHVFELPLAEDAPIARGVYRRARFDLQVDGGTAENIDLLIPEQLVGRWFGDACSVTKVADGGLGPVALLDPSADSRCELEALESELGRKVWTLDPNELDAAAFEELADSSAVILCWDLGAHSGLDVLELLRREPATRDLPIAVCFEAPTLSGVAAAFRWGATTVVSKPYAAGEIRQRLLTPAGEA